MFLPRLDNKINADFLYLKNIVNMKILLFPCNFIFNNKISFNNFWEIINSQLTSFYFIQNYQELIFGITQKDVK